MGTSFVQIERNGFWVNDSLLELFLRLAALQIEDGAGAPGIAHTIRDGWLLASSGHFNGCVPDGLHDYAADPAGKAVMVDAVRALLAALQNSPATIDRHALNLLGISGSFGADLDTWRLIELASAVLSLLAGERYGGPGERLAMPGSGAFNPATHATPPPPRR